MREFRSNIPSKNLDEMFALALIENRETQKHAVELILGRPVTPMEMAKGNIHRILTIGMGEHRDAVGTLGLLRILRKSENQIRSG